MVRHIFIIMCVVLCYWAIGQRIWLHTQFHTTPPPLTHQILRVGSFISYSSHVYNVYKKVNHVFYIRSMYNKHNRRYYYYGIKLFSTKYYDIEYVHYLYINTKVLKLIFKEINESVHDILYHLLPNVVLIVVYFYLKLLCNYSNICAMN